MWGLSASLPKVLFALHPYIQLYGFLTLFIMGVSFTLIPRFKNTSLSLIPLACAAVAATTLGDITWILAVSSILPEALLASGGLLYAIVVVKTLGRPRGPLAVSELYMDFSASALVLTLTVTLLAKLSLMDAQDLFHSLAFTQLGLLGFPGMMIFGVELRTVHFRAASLRRREAEVAFIFLVAANIAAFSAFLNLDVSRYLTTFFSICYFAGVLLFLRSVYAFEGALTSEQVERMPERDRVRYRYFSRCFTFSHIWLLLGLTLASIYVALDSVGLRIPYGLHDSIIHSLSIGFIASTIIAYAPILLPVLMAGRVPFRGLSLLPLYLVGAGLAIRLAGYLFLNAFHVFFWPAGLSGLLILAGMVHLLAMVYMLR